MLERMNFTEDSRGLFGMLLAHWAHFEMHMNKSVQKHQSLCSSQVPDPEKAPGDSEEDS